MADVTITTTVTEPSVTAAFDAVSHSHASNQLDQSNTHQSPDTDSSISALHHTLGTGSAQAASGDHTHAYSASGHTHSYLSSSSTLDSSKLTGTITASVLGNSSLYVGTTSVALNRSSTSQTLNGVSVDGNAATVTNGVYTTGTYSNPAWITALAWSKLTSTPTTLSGYGITDSQSLDGDLTAIAAIDNNSVGLLNKTAQNTWAVNPFYATTSASKSCVAGNVQTFDFSFSLGTTPKVIASVQSAHATNALTGSVTFSVYNVDSTQAHVRVISSDTQNIKVSIFAIV